MGDADYIFAFQQIVMPVANEFDPDLVISEYHAQIYGQLPDLTSRGGL